MLNDIDNNIHKEDEEENNYKNSNHDIKKHNDNTHNTEKNFESEHFDSHPKHENENKNYINNKDTEAHGNHDNDFDKSYLQDSPEKKQIKHSQLTKDECDSDIIQFRNNKLNYIYDIITKFNNYEKNIKTTIHSEHDNNLKEKHIADFKVQKKEHLENLIKEKR